MLEIEPAGVKKKKNNKINRLLALLRRKVTILKRKEFKDIICLLFVLLLVLVNF